MATASSYRNFVGIRPVLVTTVMSTAAIATATSVHVTSATGITTSSTIVILDGPLTEVKAVTGVAGTVLTVSALAHAHLKGTYIYSCPTSGFGPTNYLPLKTFKVPDKYDQLYNEAREGSMVGPIGVVQGMRESQWEIAGDFFPDSSGYVLAGIFGTEVFTTGSSTPNTHAFSVKNTGNGQPVKHAFWVYDGVNCRIVVGRFTKASLKFAPKKFSTFTASVLARASGIVTTPTKSFSSIQPMAAWTGVVTLATAYVRNTMSFEVTLERAETENIPTLTGTQDPLDTYVGALTAKVKGVFVKTGDTQLTKYLQGTTQKCVLQLTAGSGATAVQLKLQFSKANYDEVEPVLQGKAYNTESFAFSAIAQTTDHGTSGGQSPCKISLKNAVAATTYL